MFTAIITRSYKNGISKDEISTNTLEELLRLLNDSYIFYEKEVLEIHIVKEKE